MPDTSLFTSVINAYLPEPHASLLNGILFGINLKTSPDFYNRLKVVGLLHLVVLSGMNITLLASLIGSSTASFGRRISVAITIISIILFVLFVRPQPPIIRAAIMGILTLVASVYGRQVLALYLLFVSGFIIAIIWPQWLTTVSFQLSFGATLGIILFGKTKVTQSKKPIDKLKTSLYNDLRTSLSAQVFTAPLIFIYFRQISLVAPLSNLMVSFTVGPLMVLGFITALLGKVDYALGLLPSYICYGIVTYMVWVIHILSKVPYMFIAF